MENLLPLIVQLLSGALGGNVAGSLMKNLSMGTLLNSVVGILGGGIGGKVLGHQQHTKQCSWWWCRRWYIISHRRID